MRNGSNQMNIKSSLRVGLLMCLILFACGPSRESAGQDDKTVDTPRTSFLNEVMPVFMRGGCNGGGCHGFSRGQDGFKLSLFGYDPKGDFYRLTEEHFGRRINVASPKESLLLRKAAGQVPHTGGKVFDPADKHYQTLLKWIEEGAEFDSGKVPEPTQITLSPKTLQFNRPDEQMQAKVVATYSDGTTRDITDLCLFMTNNEAIATIDRSARIRAVQPGGTHVFARFDRFTVGAEVIVLSPEPFAWNDAPQLNEIDKKVDQQLKKLRILPAPLCSDEQFLRRVTIDLVGKLPTPSEYEEFMSDAAADKRSRWIDKLIEQEEFAHLWAAKWGEWLRINTDTNPGSGTAMKAGWNYFEWLTEFMVENRPWNELAEELLTGNGSNLRSPTSNYYTMLPQGKIDPARLAEDTAQIFLGLRIQCAQCHNHPFDRWTIDDYYSFTSFFTGVRRKHGSEAREYYTFVDVDAEPAKHLVDQRPMAHRFPGGNLADVQNKDPRKVLAKWMTARDNELFSRNLVNRVWDHFFGRGIIHPVDDVRISNPASNEPLLQMLSRRFAHDYKFDPKKLVREICNSRTYQSSASTIPANKRDDRWFSHAYLRRMRADVMLDCIHQALDIQPKFRRSTAERAVRMFEGGSRDNYNMYFFSTFGQAKRETVCTCETKSDANLSQTLHLINGPTLQKGLQNPSFILQIMNKAKSDKEIVAAIYVRILTRQPSPTEWNRIAPMIPSEDDPKSRQKFYTSLAWSLLNSNEFMFNH